MPTLQGYATRYHKVHSCGDNFDVFMRGSFAASLMSGKCIRLLIKHAGIELIATTRDRLQIVESDDGLPFRATLDDSAHHVDVAYMVQEGKFTEMSVGFRALRHEQRIIEGLNVRLIHEAELDEISIVAHGAVPQTCCFLVDGTKRRSLREEVKDGTIDKPDPDITDLRLKADMAAEKVIAALKKLSVM